MDYEDKAEKLENTVHTMAEYILATDNNFCDLIPDECCCGSDCIACVIKYFEEK